MIARSGIVPLHQLEQLVAVAGQPDDLEASLLQQPRKSLAQDHRVVGERYSHGISARSVVPRPGGLETVKLPPRASTRSAKPRSPEPPDVVAPPIPSSATSITSDRSSPLAVTRTSLPWECLAALVSASLARK